MVETCPADPPAPTLEAHGARRSPRMGAREWSHMGARGLRCADESAHRPDFLDVPPIRLGPAFPDGPPAPMGPLGARARTERRRGDETTGGRHGQGSGD